MSLGWPYGDGLWLVFAAFAWLAPLVLIGLVVWLIVRTATQRPPISSANEAEEVLRRRFAAGEIDAEEYERRLEILRRK
jgi:putative membrane protein